MNELTTPKEIKTLDKLFDVWERVSIQIDEDLTELGEIFDENE